MSVSSLLENTAIEERKTLNLIKLRAYKLIRREKQEDTINFIVKLRRGKKAVIWCMPNRKVVGVAIVRKLRKFMDAIEAEKGIIVANTRYTWASKREARKYSIELIPKRVPSFNIFKHKLVPKHEVLPPEKARDLLEKYHIKPYQLPRIKASDVAVIVIGAKPGDIIKITRKSPTAGKHITYRFVAPR
jgi:DNA-directed RNA polymerase subunit H (RpoH/RPB5)